MNDTVSLFDAVMGAAAPSSASLFDTVMSSPPAGQREKDPFSTMPGYTPEVAPITPFDEKYNEIKVDPKGYAKIQRFAELLGTTPEDPIVKSRLTQTMGAWRYGSLLQLSQTGNTDESSYNLDTGKLEGLGVKAALMQFGHAGGLGRRREQAIVSRIAAGQPLLYENPANLYGSSGLIPEMESKSSIGVYKKVEEMTREEQDGVVPREILKLVDQNTRTDPKTGKNIPLDAKTRGMLIVDAAKSEAQTIARNKELANLELALREEITGGSDGFWNTVGSTLIGKGMGNVGYSSTFVIGAALGGTAGQFVLGTMVSGTDKMSELLKADIDPNTGEVIKEGDDYTEAFLKGYGYGAFESATELWTTKMLLKGASILDKTLLRGYLSKTLAKTGTRAIEKMASSKIGRGIGTYIKGVMRIANMSATDNPATEILAEEGVQQLGDTLFAQRQSDTEVPQYVRLVMNEATGQMEPGAKVAPGSDEEQEAARLYKRYGEDSGYIQSGARQMLVGEKFKEYKDEFFTWENMGNMAEGFALQYLLTAGGGAFHAAQTKEVRDTMQKHMLAAGFTDAVLLKMSDEQLVNAYNGFYGDEANREKFAEVFKDAGEMLEHAADRAVYNDRVTKGISKIKSNFSHDIEQEMDYETGAPRIDDDVSGFSVEVERGVEGETFTITDRDGYVPTATYPTAQEAQEAIDIMSRVKQYQQVSMNERADVATRIAEVFAPGRNIIMVATEKDMKGAALNEGVSEEEYAPGNPGLTAKNGTVILNLGAMVNFDDIMRTIKHETGHSAGTEAGLTKLLKGKTAQHIVGELQEAGVVPKGDVVAEKFLASVEASREAYRKQGIALTDAGAVEEVLSKIQEGKSPLFRKKFGDGLVEKLKGKDASAEHMKDVRRAVAKIMYSGAAPKISREGSESLWEPQKPLFTGDPIAGKMTEAEVEAEGEAEIEAEEEVKAEGEAEIEAEEEVKAEGEAEIEAEAEVEAEGEAEIEAEAEVEAEIEAEAGVEGIEDEVVPEEPPPPPKSAELSPEDKKQAAKEIADKFKQKQGAKITKTPETKDNKAPEEGIQSSTQDNLHSKQNTQDDTSNTPSSGDSIEKEEASSDADIESPDFELEAKTAEEIEAEKKRISDKKEIEEKLAAPITGKGVDTTPDMFGGGKTPLFNDRWDKKGEKEETKATEKESEAKATEKESETKATEKESEAKTTEKESEAESKDTKPLAETTEEERSHLEELSQVFRDTMETRRLSKKPPLSADQLHRLAEIEAKLKGEVVEPNALASDIVFGHPEAPTRGDGKYDNLIPASVSDSAQVQTQIDKAQKLIDELQSKLSRSEAIVKGHIKGDKKKAEAYLASEEKTEDETIRDLLRNETLPELRHLHKMLEAQSSVPDSLEDDIRFQRSLSEAAREYLAAAQTAVDNAPTMAEKRRALDEWKAKNPEAVREIEGVDSLLGFEQSLPTIKDGMLRVYHATDADFDATQSGVRHDISTLGGGMSVHVTPQPQQKYGKKVIAIDVPKGDVMRLSRNEWAIHGRDISPSEVVGVYDPSRPSPLTLRPDGTLAGVQEQDEAPAPVEKKEKIRFSSEIELMEYVVEHPEETAAWTEDDFEIVESATTKTEAVTPEEEKAVDDGRPKLKRGQNKANYARELKQWEEEQAKKNEGGARYRLGGELAESKWRNDYYENQKKYQLRYPFSLQTDNDRADYVQISYARRETGGEMADSLVSTFLPSGSPAEITQDEANDIDKALSQLDDIVEENEKRANAGEDVTLYSESFLPNWSWEIDYSAGADPFKGMPGSKRRNALRVKAPAGNVKFYFDASVEPMYNVKFLEVLDKINPRLSEKLVATAFHAPDLQTETSLQIAEELFDSENVADDLEGKVSIYRPPADGTGIQMELFPSDKETEKIRDFLYNAGIDWALSKTRTIGASVFTHYSSFATGDYKQDHKAALQAIENAKEGDSLLYVGVAPTKNAITMSPAALSHQYRKEGFADFHLELNRQNWEPVLHFIAHPSLYDSANIESPIEVLLMKKTDGEIQNTHMPMQNAPKRYTSFAQIGAAIVEAVTPNAPSLGEMVVDNLKDVDASIREARGNAEADRGTVRYRIRDEIDLVGQFNMGNVTPLTDTKPSSVLMPIFAKQWDADFVGIVHNPIQLAEHIIKMPAAVAKSHIATADAIVEHLRANPDSKFRVDSNYHSMGVYIRNAQRELWNAGHTAANSIEGAPEDALQDDYFPASAVPVASPMKVPADLSGSIAVAMDAFLDRHPEGVDAYVAEKLGWTLDEATDGRLDGTQMDSVALLIEKIDEKTGMIIGSQTGAGKGRIMAAAMYYHMKNGRTPIFVTAKAKLFTDIWRDISALGLEEKFKPLVFNDYKAPTSDDPDSDLDDDVFSMPTFFTPMDLKVAISTKKLPKKANALFLTYSQLPQKSGTSANKVDFINRLLEGGKAGLVLDEAHLAAGESSQTGDIIRGFADLSDPGVVFSSATFAKRGENMILYKRAGYSKFFDNHRQMAEVLETGGIPFQQYLAARLSEGGFYVRHELDYTGISFEQVTTWETLATPQERTALAQHETNVADRYNEVVRGVIGFMGAVKQANKGLPKARPRIVTAGDNYASSLHNTAAFIYTALKADTVAKAAIEELRAGRSPVITLYNTNQSLLSQIGVGENADVGFYLNRIVEKAISVRTEDGTFASILTPQGYDTLLKILPPDRRAYLVALEGRARELMRVSQATAQVLREKNIPASPIDRIRETIEQAGYKFGEITGRTLQVENGAIVTRKKPNSDTVVNAFNRGGENGVPNMVLLLNSAGAAGLSAHASRTFKNQARRVMFVLQPAWDINEMMQMFGRVNRKDQISTPLYRLLFTSAAGEQRNAAILMDKLRSLSANTSGVSKAGYGEVAEDSIDFMNEFGNLALASLITERNNIVTQVNDFRPTRNIRSFTSTLQFFPVAQQEAVIELLQQKVSSLQYDAREEGAHILEAANIGRVPLTLRQMLSNNEMRAYEIPLIGKSKILTAKEAIETATTWLDESVEMLDEHHAKIEEAIKNAKNDRLIEAYKRTQDMLATVTDSIGKVYTLRSKGADQKVSFVPLSAWLPPKGKPQTASDWRVRVSFNNIRGVATMSLTNYINKFMSGQSQRSSEYEYNDTMSRSEDRTVITGDIATALNGFIVAGGGSSQIVRATPVDDNFSYFALLLPKKYNIAHARRIASATLVDVTDIRDIIEGNDGYLDIDGGRIKVRRIFNKITDAVAGAAFRFRVTRPRKGISVEDVMRAAGQERHIGRGPDYRGYISGEYMNIAESNKALSNLAALHPEFQARNIVTNEDKVKGQGTILTPSQSEGTARYRLVEDAVTLENLDAGEKIKAYAAMQLVDGKLFSPMAAKVDGKWTVPAEIGEWYQSDERPDLAYEKKGKPGIFYFKLDKGNKTQVEARYNPYFHSSLSPLNDQFASASNRANLVTVEVEIPVSDITSGYHAEKAKDPVGEHEWKSGPVARRLSGDKIRKVFLSQYRKIVRIVPDSEVAQKIAELIKGENISIPETVVAPSLLEELIKQNVPISSGATVRYRLADDNRRNRSYLQEPITIGGLKTQAELEDEAYETGHFEFKILRELRGGASKIVIPNIPLKELGYLGEYDWFSEMGGFSAFNMAERRAFFKLSDTKSGNIDSLAGELGYDNVEDFVSEFLDELQRSREMYAAQKERQDARREILKAASENSVFAKYTQKQIGVMMGEAIGVVSGRLPEYEHIDMMRIQEKPDGDNEVRHYVLTTHPELVLLEMMDAIGREEWLKYRENADILPPEIEDRGTMRSPERINAEGDTQYTYNQTKARLSVISAKLYGQKLEGVSTITDQDAADFVDEALRMGGKEFIRSESEKMIRSRLTGKRTTPLNKYETAFLLWYQTDLDTRTRQTDIDARSAMENSAGELINDLPNLEATEKEREDIHRKTLDYLTAAREFGSLSGQSLQALKLRVDNNFNIVRIYREAVEDNGDTALSPEQYAVLKKRIAELEKKWEAYAEVGALLDSSDGDMERQIADLESKIEESKAVKTEAIKTQEDLKTQLAKLNAELNAQSSELNELSEQKALLEDQIATLEREIAIREALNQKITLLQEQVSELRSQIETLDAKYEGASPDVLESLRDQINALNAEYVEKQEEYERADREVKKANARLQRVRKLFESLTKGTQSKIARRRTVLNNAAVLYGDFKKAMEEAQVDRLARRWSGAKRGAKLNVFLTVTRDSIRALQSMGDESVVGRQLIKLGLAHPILFGKAFVQSQSLVFSRAGMVDERGRTLTWEERSDRMLFELDQMLKEHPLYDILVRKGKLSWMNLTVDPSSFDEQQTPVGPLLNRLLPSKATRLVTSVLGVSNNHYAGMSNLFRFAAACELYKQMNIAKGAALDAADIEAIVSTVDIFGGRGNITSQRAQSFVTAGANFLYSPRLAMSNLQFYKRMIGFAFDDRNSKHAKAMIARQYLQMGLSYAAVSIATRLLSRLFSEDKDEQRHQFTPGHASFLMLMFGQTRLDISGGAAMWARSIAAILGLGDKHDIETGMVTQTWENRSRPDGNAAMRLLRSKLDPWTGMMMDITFGKTYRGFAAGPFAKETSENYKYRYLNMMSSITPVPLSVQSLVETLKGDPEYGTAPLRNPFMIAYAMGAEIIGSGANNLPINANLSMEVAEGITHNAEKLAKLKREMGSIRRDKEMTPERKEIKSERIQTKIDYLRGN